MANERWRDGEEIEPGTQGDADEVVNASAANAEDIEFEDLERENEDEYENEGEDEDEVA